MKQNEFILTAKDENGKWFEMVINSNLDLYANPSQLRYAMEVEYKICKSQNNEKKFAKYNFVYENP